MVGPRNPAPTKRANMAVQQKRTANTPEQWFKLPLQPVTDAIPNPTSIERVEYHLHFGKEARGWRNLHKFSRGRPSLPNLRTVRVVIDGSALDKLTVAQCQDFRLTAELIGSVDFHVERVEVVYLPHRRTGEMEKHDEPDDGTFTRDEVQDTVVRGVGMIAGFGRGRVVCEAENEVWPGRKVEVESEEPMRLVYRCGRWD